MFMIVEKLGRMITTPDPKLSFMIWRLGDMDGYSGTPEDRGWGLAIICFGHRYKI